MIVIVIIGVEGELVRKTRNDEKEKEKENENKKSNEDMNNNNNKETYPNEKGGKDSEGPWKIIHHFGKKRRKGNRFYCLLV